MKTNPDSIHRNRSFTAGQPRGWRWLATLAVCLWHGHAGAADAYWFTIFDKYQTAEISLNGYPIGSAAGTNTFTATSVLTPYIVAGENVIIIRSTDPDTNTIPEANVVRLTLDYGGDSVIDRQLLFTVERQFYFVETNSVESIRFSSTNADVQVRGRLAHGATKLEISREARTHNYRVLTSAPPHVIEVRTTCDQAVLNSLPWIGQSVTLTDQDKTDITTLVQSIYSSLTNQDYTAYFQLAQTKNQRLAQAVGQTLAQRQTESQEFFEGLRAKPGFAFSPLNTGGFTYRSYPDANLIQVFSAGAPPIQATATELTFKLSIFVSKIGGVWVWVD